MNQPVVQIIGGGAFWLWLLGMVVVGTKTRRAAGFGGSTMSKALSPLVELRFFALISLWPFTREQRAAWVRKHGRG